MWPIEEMVPEGAPYTPAPLRTHVLLCLMSCKLTAQMQFLSLIISSDLPSALIYFKVTILASPYYSNDIQLLVTAAASLEMSVVAQLTQIDYDAKSLQSSLRSLSLSAVRFTMVAGTKQLLMAFAEFCVTSRMLGLGQGWWTAYGAKHLDAFKCAKLSGWLSGVVRIEQSMPTYAAPEQAYKAIHNATYTEQGVNASWSNMAAWNGVVAIATSLRLLMYCFNNGWLFSYVAFGYYCGA